MGRGPLEETQALVDPPDRYLLLAKLKYSLKTKEWYNLNQMGSPLLNSGLQIGSKLYLFGRLKHVVYQSKRTFSKQFISMDDNGKYTELEQILKGREKMALGGSSSHLMAVGGNYLTQTFKRSEMYSIKANKWSGLPPLRVPRCDTTVCLLEFKRAYCFGGRDA